MNRKNNAQGISREHQAYLSEIKKSHRRVRLWQVFILIAFFVVWEAAARLQLIDPFIMSQPSRVWRSFINLYNEGSLLLHIGYTLGETIAGFLISTILGFIVAVLLWWFPTSAKILDPYLVVLNALPKIAMGPIIIVWAGAGPSAIIVVAVLVAVVVTVITVYNGFMQTDEDKVFLLRSFGANRWQVFAKVVLPANIPVVLSVLKINIGLAWVGVIVGEFLVSKAGLGYLIVYGGQVFKLDLVMVSIVILSILTALMYQAIVGLEKITTKIWQV